MARANGEAGVLRACLDLLAVERIWHMRLNTGAMAGSHNGKKWFVRFAKPGCADILAAPHGHYEIAMNEEMLDFGKAQCPYFLWLEIKSSIGKQRPEQKAFEQEVTEQGHTYLLINDVDQLRVWLVKHRIC